MAPADESGLEPSLEGWLRQRGKALYTPDGSLGFEGKDIADWFDYWGRLRKMKACVPPEMQALDQLTVQTAMISQNKAAISFAHSNQFVAYQGINKDKLGMMPYPVPAKDGKPGQYLKPSMLMSVSASSKNKDAAVAFVNYLVEDPAAAKILGVERGVPASEAMRKELAPTLDALGQADGRLHSEADAEGRPAAATAAERRRREQFPAAEGLPGSRLREDVFRRRRKELRREGRGQHQARLNRWARSATVWPRGGCSPFPRRRGRLRLAKSPGALSRNAPGYLFLLPWFIGFFGLTLGPALVSLYLSFTDYNLLQAPHMVGLDNYVRIFTADDKFVSSMKVTLFYRRLSRSR